MVKKWKMRNEKCQKEKDPLFVRVIWWIVLHQIRQMADEKLQMRNGK